MKSSENSFDTPKGCLSCSIRLGNHFSPTEKKTFFGEKLRKCRIVPRNANEGQIWDSLTYILLQNIEKLEGVPFETLKNSHSAGKTSKRGPFSLVWFRKVKKRKGGDFALSLHWSDLA